NEAKDERRYREYWISELMLEEVDSSIEKDLHEKKQIREINTNVSEKERKHIRRCLSIFGKPNIISWHNQGLTRIVYLSIEPRSEKRKMELLNSWNIATENRKLMRITTGCCNREELLRQETTNQVQTKNKRFDREKEGREQLGRRVFGKRKQVDNYRLENTQNKSRRTGDYGHIQQYQKTNQKYHSVIYRENGCSTLLKVAEGILEENVANTISSVCELATNNTDTTEQVQAYSVPETD
ncbi:29312_t:CDS:2, partial [Gigaspora margarita]